MEEKKFVNFKKEELSVKEHIKNELGKGKISTVSIEYTPIGEKIIVATSKPGLVIGRKGERIDSLTKTLKRRFKLDNPHIEIKEITEANLDAQLVADEIALLLERRGPLKFKLIAYRMLKEIMKSGALGSEIVLSGKLPSERSRTWRFAQGYLKKTGEPSKMVDRAIAQSNTLPGIVGIKVAILGPDVKLLDRIIVNDELRNKIKATSAELSAETESEEEKIIKKKTTKKKTTNKKPSKEETTGEQEEAAE